MWVLSLATLAATSLKSVGPSNNRDRKSTRLNSSHGYISYAVFFLKKKKFHKEFHSEAVNEPLTATALPAMLTLVSLVSCRSTRIFALWFPRTVVVAMIDFTLTVGKI